MERPSTTVRYVRWNGGWWTPDELRAHMENVRRAEKIAADRRREQRRA